MRIHIYYQTTEAPWGGVNSFLKAFKYFVNGQPELGHKIVEQLTDPCDVFLINSGYKAPGVLIDLAEIRALKSRGCARPLIVCRLDGLRAKYAQMTDELDQLQFEALKLCDLVIFQSQESLRSFQQLGYQGENHVIIFNGVNQNIFNFRDKKFWDGRRKLRFFSCNWSSNINKGYEAISRFSLNPYVECLFAGRWCPEVPVNNVKCFPAMKQEELAELYRSCDLFIHAAKNDPCPNVVLEALSCGLPILYHNSGGTAEIAAKYGLPLPEVLDVNSTNELVNQLIAHYPQLVRNILKDYQSFSIEQVAKQYLQAFEKALPQDGANFKHLPETPSSQSWLTALPNQVLKFLQTMQSEQYSTVRYSYSGDLYENYQTWGLGNSVFATKILYVLDQLDKLPSLVKENLFNKIISFSQPDGYISDPLITSDLPSNSPERENIKRAETRQAFVALHLLGRRPRFPFTALPQDELQVTNFLESFDWSNPWHAASHLSHLLFFCQFNAQFFKQDEGHYEKLIAHILRWLETLQSPVDGCWYRHNPNLTLRINGAMKVMTGLHAINHYEFPYPERLIDTALAGANQEGACDNFNIAYVLYGATRISPVYRRAEIDNFLGERVNIYRQFFHEELGGFSFYLGKANDVYYGKKLSGGINEPDIHGTNMFVCGLAIIGQMIDLGINLKVPLS